MGAAMSAYMKEQSSSKNVFNSNLKAFRQKLGISAKEFAEKLGIKYTTYIAYEDLELDPPREPRYDVLIRMADVFGISVDTLLGHYTDNYAIMVEKLSLCIEKIGYIVKRGDNGILIGTKEDEKDFILIATYSDRGAFIRNMKVIFPNAELPGGLKNFVLMSTFKILLGVELPGVKVEKEFKQSLFEADERCRNELLQYAEMYDTEKFRLYRKCCELQDEYEKIENTNDDIKKGKVSTELLCSISKLMNMGEKMNNDIDNLFVNHKDGISFTVDEFKKFMEANRGTKPVNGD